MLTACEAAIVGHIQILKLSVEREKSFGLNSHMKLLKMIVIQKNIRLTLFKTSYCVDFSLFKLRPN